MRYKGNCTYILSEICELFATHFEDSFVSKIVHPDAVTHAPINTAIDDFRLIRPVVKL